MYELSQVAKDVCGIIGAVGLLILIVGLLLLILYMYKKEEKAKEVQVKLMKEATKYLEIKNKDNKQC